MLYGIKDFRNFSVRDIISNQLYSHDEVDKYRVSADSALNR